MNNVSSFFFLLIALGQLGQFCLLNFGRGSAKENAAAGHGPTGKDLVGGGRHRGREHDEGWQVDEERESERERGRTAEVRLVGNPFFKLEPVDYDPSSSSSPASGLENPPP